MPDNRVDRGAHPKDADCFADAELEKLRAAVADLSWLLERGYTKKAGLTLVGNRYGLRDRQRKAVQRTAAAGSVCERREARRVERARLAGEHLAVDGYNVLLTIEAALSGGVLLLARDGVLRDLTAMSRHYRRVRTTLRALELLGDFCVETRARRWIWYFDQPVSNSGRLKAIIDDLHCRRRLPWEVHLVANPDPVLSTHDAVVATADSGILDHGPQWFNLAREVVAGIPQAWILDLSR